MIFSIVFCIFVLFCSFPSDPDAHDLVKTQIVCISHLPQIASKGECHYRVFKHSDNNETLSSVVRLSHKERILILKIAERIGRRLREYSVKEVRGTLDVWRHMFEYLNAPKLLRVFNKVNQAGGIVNDARNREVLSNRRATVIQSIIKH